MWIRSRFGRVARPVVGFLLGREVFRRATSPPTVRSDGGWYLKVRSGQVITEKSFGIR